MKKLYIVYIYPDNTKKCSKLLTVDINSYSFKKLIEVLLSYNKYSICLLYIQ